MTSLDIPRLAVVATLYVFSLHIIKGLVVFQCCDVFFEFLFLSVNFIFSRAFEIGVEKIQFLLSGGLKASPNEVASFDTLL